MAMTLIEKIISRHSECETVAPGDIVDVLIDARVARDFGGANVVKNIRDNGLAIDDPARTFFTFDCNPTGSDQKYAANQQACRVFARERGIRVFDIDAGIGTHVAIDEGLIGPGGVLVSTDSHANILGAIGAFGQGMGDVDIAQAWARGRVWFEVPPSVKVLFKGIPSEGATAKDLTLAMLRALGANGLLGVAAEIVGEAAISLDLAGRITLASMATEMGGIAALIPPSESVISYCRDAGAEFETILADEAALYEREVEIDVEGLPPLISRPGNPENVVTVDSIQGEPVDSVFIGSCTNGRYEDLVAAVHVLRGRRVASGVVLKIVPATDAIWRRCLAEGLFDVFKNAGAMIGNAGCAGCAAGQIGQNGPGEVTISTGNRNFAGKQGKGEVYLASPRTAAASAVAGAIVSAEALQSGSLTIKPRAIKEETFSETSASATADRPIRVRGRVWIIERDNIDTDMIYHNQYLTITNIDEMGQYTFNNLSDWEDFSKKARSGDIVIVGKNFGCGSSRQQAVDCFKSIGVAVIIAESFGAIYKRNAINSAMPIMEADLAGASLSDGDEVSVDFKSGEIKLSNGQVIRGKPFSDVQLEIYQRGGLLSASL